MRKFVYVFVLCMLTVCTLVGCKKDPGTEPETIVGNVSEPAWTMPEKYDYNLSMTAIVKVDLKESYPQLAKDFVLTEKDRLAAFSDSACLGVIYPKDGLFYLFISSPESAVGDVTLRFYSAHYKNLFEAVNTIKFANDARLGTVAEPLCPLWKVSR